MTRAFSSAIWLAMITLDRRFIIGKCNGDDSWLKHGSPLRQWNDIQTLSPRKSDLHQVVNILGMPHRQWNSFQIQSPKNSDLLQIVTCEIVNEFVKVWVFQFFTTSSATWRVFDYENTLKKNLTTWRHVFDGKPMISPYYNSSYFK